MPVINHDVHPSTVQGLNHHYGCWNLPEYLDHAMSNRCRYDMSLKDRYCADCVHRGKGEAYEESVRRDAC